MTSLHPDIVLLPEHTLYHSHNHIHSYALPILYSLHTCMQSIDKNTITRIQGVEVGDEIIRVRSMYLCLVDLNSTLRVSLYLINLQSKERHWFHAGVRECGNDAMGCDGMVWDGVCLVLLGHGTRRVPRYI